MFLRANEFDCLDLDYIKSQYIKSDFIRFDNPSSEYAVEDLINNKCNLDLYTLFLMYHTHQYKETLVNGSQPLVACV